MARKQTPPQTGTGSPPKSATRLGAAIDVLSTAFSCLLLLAIVVGMIVGREAMLRYAARQRTAHVQIRFDWPPLAVPPGGVLHHSIDGVPNTWLDVQRRRELENLVQAKVSPEPFDNASLRAAQTALMATGWFESGCTVTREPTGVIRVTGDWRIPAAAVRSGGRDYVVTWQGERLDADYPVGGSGLKVVRGPQMKPPALGEAWLGGDVQAGLALLGFLREMPFDAQIACVDVSEYNSRRRLLIVTDRATQIVWGGEPGQFHPGQARDDTKRARLMRLFRESGRIDKGEETINVSLSSPY